MKKPTAKQLKTLQTQLTILTVTAAVMLLLALTAHTPTTGNQTISQDTNASKALTFNLKTGQTVSGYFSLGINVVNYTIYNQNIGEILNQKSTGKIIHYTFTAPTDGQYYLNIRSHGQMIYHYTISPAFLGLNVSVWIAATMTTGIALAVYVSLKREPFVKKI